jgi:inhibitor of KinA sporulation pathway (predicted exonuclease)
MVSCGDFDGKALAKESKFKNCELKDYLHRWINIKKAFPSHCPKPAELKADAFESRHLNFTAMGQMSKAKNTSNGMTDMLAKLGLELEGRHHSGIDDSRNIARCAMKLMSCGMQFTNGMVMEGHD